MIKKKIASVLLGTAISGAILFFMATLVVPSGKPPESLSLDKMAIHMQAKMSDIAFQPREKRPPLPEALPEIPPELSVSPLPATMNAVSLTPSIELALTPSTVRVALPNIGKEVSNTNTLSLSTSFDSQTVGYGLLTPLHRIEPIYPQRALQAKIEGFVTVSFNVNAKGEVEDLVVIEAKPRRYFERAAIDAVKKWRYQARTLSDNQSKQKQTVTLEFKF